ncbi:MAG: hypothetical protein ACR2G0_00375, partial [Chthoniobacterales bacterium]
MKLAALQAPLSCIVIAVFGAISASAQTTDVDRARLFRSQSSVQAPVSVSPEGVDQGYAAASPNDNDLGEQAILKRSEQYDPFTLEVGLPIYYTSNATLVDQNRRDDVIIAPVVGLSYAPKLGGNFSGDFGVRQQFFYYQNTSSFNFASFDALVGVSYGVPQFHNLTLRANLDYNRLTGTSDFGAFFSNLGLGLSAEIPIRLSRAQQISFGADTSISLWANPAPPQRSDFGLFVGYNIAVTRSFSLNAAGRLVVRPYHEGSRTDVSEILALSANYRFGEWLTLSALSTFVANQSNQNGFGYEVLN